MKKNELKTIFKMAYSALMQLGDKAVMLISRDATELASYGVDEPMKNNVIDKTLLLKEMPTDEELLAEVSVKTEEKNELSDAIRNAIRTITIRAKNVYGDKSAKYKRFGIKDIDKMTDDELYRCAKRVSRTATGYLPELAPKGLTEAEITELTNKAESFDDIIDAKDEAVRIRDIATEERVGLSNELYKLISEVFDYGKNYWYTREEAKYNDYIIYDTPNGTTKPTIKVAAGTIVTLIEEGVEILTVFEIENTGNAQISFYVADNADAQMPDNAETLEPKETRILKAENISDGTYGKLIAANKSDTDGQITFIEVK